MNYDANEIQSWRESAELLQMLHVKMQFKLLVLGIVRATDVVPNKHTHDSWAKNLFDLRNHFLQDDGGISGAFDDELWYIIAPTTMDQRRATMQQIEMLRALFNERHLRRASEKYNAYKAERLKNK